MLFGFSLRLGDFLHILTSKMHLQNHLNIDFWSSRVDLSSIWCCKVESGWILTGLGSIFHWFGIDFGCIFKWSERTFCKQWLDEQYALIAALNIAICCHIDFSRWHLVRRAAHRASAASPTGSARRAEYKSISLTFPTWTWHKFKQKIKNIPQRISLKFDACWAPPIL